MMERTGESRADRQGLLTLGAALLLAIIGLAGGMGTSEAPFATTLADARRPTSAVCGSDLVVFGGGSRGAVPSFEQELHANVLRGSGDLGIEPGACEDG